MRSAEKSLLGVAAALVVACTVYTGGKAGDLYVDDAGGPREATAPDFDSAVVDSPDASGDVADAGDPCDKDQDGYVDRTCKGGVDCCDIDPKVHPGVTDFFSVRNACARWDYNCDDVSEQKYHAGGSCPTDCNDDYLTQPTACGDPGTLVHCSGWLICGTSSSSVTQACR